MTMHGTQRGPLCDNHVSLSNVKRETNPPFGRRLPACLACLFIHYSMLSISKHCFKGPAANAAEAPLARVAIRPIKAPQCRMGQ